MQLQNKSILILFISVILLFSGYVLPESIRGISTELPGMGGCTALWQPVCGVNGETYSNDCYARVANVNVACEGVCPCFGDEDPPEILAMRVDPYEVSLPGTKFTLVAGISDVSSKLVEGSCFNLAVSQELFLRLEDFFRYSLSGHSGTCEFSGPEPPPDIGTFQTFLEGDYAILKFPSLNFKANKDFDVQLSGPGTYDVYFSNDDSSYTKCISQKGGEKTSFYLCEGFKGEDLYLKIVLSNAEVGSYFYYLTLVQISYEGSGVKTVKADIEGIGLVEFHKSNGGYTATVKPNNLGDFSVTLLAEDNYGNVKKEFYPDLFGIRDQSLCVEVVGGHNNLDENRFNLVFKNIIYDDIELLWEVVRSLYYKFFSVEPYKSNKNKFNFWTVNDIRKKIHPSLECPEDLPLRYPIKLINNGAGALCGPGSDICCSPSGGCWCFLHETGGHNIGCLQDEYIGAMGGPGPPNCAATQEDAELWWGDLYCQDIYPYHVGFYEGCKSLYWIRPTYTSIMRESAASKFGLVNERNICAEIIRKTGSAAGYCDRFGLSALTVNAMEVVLLNKDGEFEVKEVNPAKEVLLPGRLKDVSHKIKIITEDKVFEKNFNTKRTIIEEDFSETEIKFVSSREVELEEIRILVPIGQALFESESNTILIDSTKNSFTIDIQQCLALYDPVCGVDGKTYNNDCYAQQAGVAIACEGECPCDGGNLKLTLQGAKSFTAPVVVTIYPKGTTDLVATLNVSSDAGGNITIDPSAVTDIISGDNYDIKIKVNGYLVKKVTTILPPTTSINIGQLLIGDYNGDNKVTALDFAVWVASYRKSLPTGDPKDINQDGKVSALDFAIWVSNYRKVGD